MSSDKKRRCLECILLVVGFFLEIVASTSIGTSLVRKPYGGTDKYVE